ncbi:hypothetical protein SALBM217S_07824 [Streptomyces griseoloalbus]
MTTNGGFQPVFCTIVPPHVLDRLSQADDPLVHGPARRTLRRDAYERTQRRLTTVVGAPAVATPSRTPSPASPGARVQHGHGADLPSKKARGEGEDARPGTATVEPHLRGARRRFRPVPEGVRPGLDKTGAACR